MLIDLFPAACFLQLSGIISLQNAVDSVNFMPFIRKKGARLSACAPIYTILDYSCGPAATRALPASLPSYLAKFLMKREAKSLAFSSHSAGLA